MTCRSAVLSLCLASSICCAADGRVSGQVTDSQGKPIASAKIRLAPSAGANTKETTSDSDGRFAFPSLPPRAYQLSAVTAGFVEARQTIQLSDGESLTV